MAQKRYRALTGLNFPASELDRAKHKKGEPCTWTRIEAGETTDAIHPTSLKWLLRDGHIEEVTDGG
jgi:hypothetical protein